MAGLPLWVGQAPASKPSEPATPRKLARSDGKYFRFKARKGVALCAGDFAGNREMVIDLMDELRNFAEAQGGANLLKATGNTRPIARDGTGVKLGV